MTESSCFSNTWAVIDVLTAGITAEGDRTKMTTSNTETATTDTAVAEPGANVAPQRASSKKAARTKKSAPKGQKSGKGGKPKAAATAKPKKAAKAPPESPTGQGCPRGQQDRQGPGPAQAPQRRHPEGPDEGHRLAAAFSPGLPLRNRRQEVAAGGHVHQGRGRGAQLLPRQVA